MSMQRYQRSLVTLLKQTGLPVYAAGQVPRGASFPYITLTCAYAPFAQSAGVTLTAWFLGDYTGCVQLMDQLCALIPQQGVLLRYPGSMALLHPMAGSFVSLVGDESDSRLVGGRMRLNVHLYDAEKGE